MDNRINVVLTPENKETVFQAIRSAKTGLPFLIKLSKSERDAILKVDDDRKPFVEKARLNVKMGIPGSQAIVDKPGKRFQQKGAPSRF